MPPVLISEPRLKFISNRALKFIKKLASRHFSYQRNTRWNHETPKRNLIEVDLE